MLNFFRQKEESQITEKPQIKALKKRLYKRAMTKELSHGDWQKLEKYLASSPTYTKILLFYRNNNNKPSIIPFHGDYVGINAMLARKKAPYRLRQYTYFHCTYHPITDGQDRLYCFYKKKH